jgi:CheY-like chemotaxis protein
VLLQVEDTGVGIGPDHLDRIFSEFEQESKGYTRDYEGVGIGLAITRRLTKLLGGTIDVESEKGSGTVFTVRLPAENDPSASPPAEQSAPSQPSTQPRPTSSSAPSSRRAASTMILLLDDNEMTRKVLPMLLSEADDRFEMHTAVTADEALSAAREVEYGLFLIDINLGTKETGIDVMRALRELPSHADTGMVACTAYAMPGDEEKFLEAGFDAYLAKPFRSDELLAVIEAHCA